MDQHKEQFINFLLRNKALLFGEFKLKSGRMSPYFFNLGCLNSGCEISQLGNFYAQVIVDHWKDRFDIVFGPAYKGIPLSVAIVDSLHRDFKLNRQYSSNRKEIKTHGDKSVLLGADIKAGDKIILVDDVLTTGQTKIDAVNLIKSIADVEIIGLVIALDRLEKDQADKNAVTEFASQTGVPVKSIISVNDLITLLASKKEKGNFSAPGGILEKLRKYLKEHGV